MYPVKNFNIPKNLLGWIGSGLFLCSITGFYKGDIVIDLDQKGWPLSKGSALCQWVTMQKPWCRFSHFIPIASHHALQQHTVVYLFEIHFKLVIIDNLKANPLLSSHHSP